MSGQSAHSNLSVEEQIVLTALRDRVRRGDDPGTVEDLAAATAWPGERGVDRTRRILRELQASGLVRRIASRTKGVRWIPARWSETEEPKS